ncbi:MAG: M50 family metallopeptidase [Gemmatimonadota bacterium]
MQSLRIALDAPSPRAATPPSPVRVLGGFAIWFGLLWTFWETPAFTPVKIFVVLLHELSHALAAVLTGGTVRHITLDAMQGGATVTTGGSAFVILSSGYLGSLLLGGLLLVAGMVLRKGLRPALGGVALVVLGATVFLIRSAFGFAYGLTAGLVLLAVARWLPAWVSRAVLIGLGLTSCLYAILDIKSDVFDRPGAPSDAYMLAEMTGVPTLVWGVLWAVLAFAFAAVLLRWAYRRAARG